MNALPNLIAVTLAAAPARTAGTKPNSVSSNAFDDVMSAQQSRSQPGRSTALARDDRPTSVPVRSRDSQDPRPTPASPASRDDASHDDSSIRDHGGDADDDNRRDASRDHGAAPDNAAGVTQAPAGALGGSAAATPAAGSAAGSAESQGISGIIGRAGLSGVAGPAGAAGAAGSAAAIPAGAGAATGGQPGLLGQLGATGSLGQADQAAPGGGSVGDQAGAGAPAGAGTPAGTGGPAGPGAQAGAGAGVTPIPPGGLVALGPAAGGPIAEPGAGGVPGPASGPPTQSDAHLGQLGPAGQISQTGQTGPGQPSALLGRSPLQAAPGQSSGPGSATATVSSSSAAVPDPGGVGTMATGASVTTSGGQGVSASDAALTAGRANQSPGGPTAATDLNAAGQPPVIAPAPSAITAAAVQAATGTGLPAGIGPGRLGARASGDQNTGTGGVSPLNPAVPSAVSPSAGTIAPAVAIQPPAPVAQAQPVITQVMDHLIKQQLITARNLHDGTHQAVIRLNPANLGQVTVTMDVRAGQVRIDLAAGTQALATLGSDLGQLRSQLADAGLNLADVTLSSQTTDSGAGQPAPRRDDGQPAPARTSSSADQPMTGRGSRNDSVRQIRERSGLAAAGSLDLLA